MSSYARGITAVLWAVAAAAVVALYAAGIAMGDLNQDEGWYLYAARLVGAGQLPFIDFASTQGPVLPFVYALANPLVDRFGVAGGRLFTALLGLLTVAGSAWLAWRLAPAERRGWAAFLAFVLVGVNTYQVAYWTMVKTYALAGILLVLGFIAWPGADITEPRRRFVRLFIAGFLMMLAAATRLSAVAVPVAAVIGLAWQARTGDRRRGADAVALAVGALAGGTVFLPFLVRAPEALRFALVEYHSGREVGGLIPALAYKAGFAGRLFQDYSVALTLALAAGVMGAIRRWAPGERAHDPMAAGSGALTWMAVGYAAVTAIHLATKFPYDDYQVMALPLLAVPLAVGLTGWAEPLSRLANRGREAVSVGIAAGLLCVSAAAAASSPVLHGWFLGERDRIWWPLKTEPPLRRLHRVADLVRGELLVAPGSVLLTQDTYLAVEAGLRVPHGLELGPFSYFPDWSRAKATACHVVNREMLVEILRTSDAPVAAFSGYGFAIQAPRIVRVPPGEQAELQGILEQRYRKFREVEKFGQAQTTLRIYLKTSR